MSEIDTDKVNSFFHSLNDVEWRYTKNCMEFADGIKELIKEFEITAEEFCKDMDIPLSRYKAYTIGAVNYSVMDMAKTQSIRYKKLMERKEKEAAKESEMVNFPDYKYSQGQVEGTPKT